MLNFYGKNLKSFLALGLIGMTLSTASLSAEPEKLEKPIIPPAITFSADKTAPTVDGKGKMLLGRVEIAVGNKIKISAERVFVRYTDGKQHKVSEFTIFGKGILKEDGHPLTFVNGTFNPMTSQLFAEKIERQ